MLDFITKNSYVLLIIAGLIASWLKSQKEAKEERAQQDAQRRRASDQQETQEYEFDKNFDFGDPQYPGQIPPKRPTRAPSPAVPPALPKEAAAPVAPAPSLKKSSVQKIQADPSDEIARQKELLDRIEELKQAKLEKNENTDAPAHSYSQQEKTTPSSSKGILSRLKKTSELRQAIILKEILEKPLGLR